ncbi:hypothetical protein C8R44DRAFT_985275 [Mycena epipterygia]|nr:hypothetical protein C8R44DRAFT_985275 [Mycena epipterygia]
MASESLQAASSETKSDALTVLPSPILRIPSELLVEIFSLCWFSFTPAFDVVIRTKASFEVEIQRLAHLLLLTLSQVCSRWHAIAMGTPSLWATIELDNVLWDVPVHAEKVVRLLRCSLDRGSNCLIDLSIANQVNKPAFQPVIDLLASNSERWRSLELHASVSFIEAFSGIRGRLPRLASLNIDIFDQESDVVDLFSVAPNLERVTFRQLDFFSWCSVLMDDAPTLATVLLLLTHGAEFEFALDILADDASQIPTLNIPPITSQLSTLSIIFTEDFHRPHAHQVLGEIFDRLTLPTLEGLSLQSELYPNPDLSWPHTQFLDFSTRCSLNDHLQYLSLYHVIIPEVELLACLSALPSLERLEISDHQAVPTSGEDNHHLITDSLLTALTRIPDSPCLVPALHSLGVQSLLAFNESLYLVFLLSRLDPDWCFESSIFWIPGHHRELDANVVVLMDELYRQGVLSCEFLSAEPPTET